MKAVYDEMWQQALPLLKNGQVETDPLVFSKNDTRRGLTLLFRPPYPVLNNIQNFLREARLIEPGQYFYPISDMHLTVLSIISCRPDFYLNQIEPEEYQRLIKNAISQTTPFQLTFRGITASPGTVMVQGFDESGQLELLRNSLRENFKNSPLEHSIDQRYKIRTAHLTVVRFAERLENPTAFAGFLEKYRYADFGVCRVNDVELVFNDWYQQREHTHRMAIFLFAN